jgi:hypothetical protein
MEKLFVISLMIIIAAGSPVFADLVPPWRGEEGSTYQQWDFSADDRTPPPEEGNVYNPYGNGPQLRVDTPFDWYQVIDSASGVWPLSGEIDVYIPNRQLPLDQKDIWIQLIWKQANLDPDPFLPDEPIVGVTPFDSMTMSREDLRGREDWTHSQFKIEIHPNPDAEWITIKGDILVDQLIIETYCIPEPATIALLGIGGLITLRRKRSLNGFLCFQEKQILR